MPAIFQRSRIGERGGALFWASTALVVAGGAALAGAIFFLVPLFAGSPARDVPVAVSVVPVAVGAPAADAASAGGAFRERMQAAASLQEAEDYAGALAAYASLAADFPGNQEPAARLEMLAAFLRSNGFSMTPAKFQTLRPGLQAAAGHGVVSAQMLLGEELRETSPTEALKYLRAAADAGQTEAMTLAGLMVSNGRGVGARDMKRAVAWFERAADAGDTDAMTALAECLIHGKGVARNPRRAAGLLQAASAFQHPRALNLLGDLYARGSGVAQDYAQAYELFARSAAGGYGDGLANQGALLMRGEGVAADPARAIQLWRSGIAKGFPSCMLNYARALESGKGVPADASQARHWYREAARGGNDDAIAWCRANGVAF